MISCPRCKGETSRRTVKIGGIEITKHICAGCDSAFYFEDAVFAYAQELGSKK